MPLIMPATAEMKATEETPTTPGGHQQQWKYQKLKGRKQQQ
jgi:hypothetical protein